MPHLKTILHHPLGQNSDNFASPPCTNRQPANDLHGRADAKFGEFCTHQKKEKNFAGAKIMKSSFSPPGTGRPTIATTFATHMLAKTKETGRFKIQKLFAASPQLLVRQ